MEIKYVKVKREEFGERSLDGFQRLQSVSECWRSNGNTYSLQPVVYTEDWNLYERRDLAKRIAKGLDNGCVLYAALYENEIIGFAYLESGLFGSGKQYIDLAEFYVSAPFRKKGVGKKLFDEACLGAAELGAKKLYISAHSAKESIAAYKKYGCTLPEEIHAVLAEKEPCDLQLEYDLRK